MFLFKEGRQRFSYTINQLLVDFQDIASGYLGIKLKKKKKKKEKDLPLCGSKIGREDWTEDEQHIPKVVWRGPEESRISERLKFLKICHIISQHNIYYY